MNLIPVCDGHHHQVHEGGWSLALDRDRTITLRAPDGTVVYHGDSRDRIEVDAAEAGPAHAAHDGGGPSPAGEAIEAAGRLADGAGLRRHRADESTAAQVVRATAGPIRRQGP